VSVRRCPYDSSPVLESPIVVVGVGEPGKKGRVVIRVRRVVISRNSIEKSRSKKGCSDSVAATTTTTHFAFFSRDGGTGGAAKKEGESGGPSKPGSEGDRGK